jgi:hypothetical protein
MMNIAYHNNNQFSVSKTPTNGLHVATSEPFSGLNMSSKMSLDSPDSHPMSSSSGPELINGSANGLASKFVVTSMYFSF